MILTFQREAQRTGRTVATGGVGREVLPDLEPSLSGPSRLGIGGRFGLRHVRGEVLQRWIRRCLPVERRQMVRYPWMIERVVRLEAYRVARRNSCSRGRRRGVRLVTTNELAGNIRDL